jgi:membrane-bound inhibitor of C-type lysozyme
MGSATILTPGEGVYLSDDHPISAAVVVNVTDNFFSYGIYGSGAQYSDNIDLYWFKVIGEARVFINGIGVGI